MLALLCFKIRDLEMSVTISYLTYFELSEDRCSSVIEKF